MLEANGFSLVPKLTLPLASLTWVSTFSATILPAVELSRSTLHSSKAAPERAFLPEESYLVSVMPQLSEPVPPLDVATLNVWVTFVAELFTPFSEQELEKFSIRSPALPEGTTL